MKGQKIEFKRISTGYGSNAKYDTIKGVILGEVTVPHEIEQITKKGGYIEERVSTKIAITKFIVKVDGEKKPTIISPYEIDFQDEIEDEDPNKPWNFRK